MTQTFRCPACNAPLNFEGKSVQTCRFCGSSVIVPAQMFQKSDANIFDDVIALGKKAAAFADVHKEIQAGRKINAIKIFREITNCGLAEAKDAVEAMERGESVDISTINVRNAKLRSEMMNVKRENKYSEPPDLILNTPYKEAIKNHQTERKSGFGGTFLIFLLTSGAICLVLYFSLWSSNDKLAPLIRTGNISIDQSKRKPPFAQEILKFGGEGTGAGKFKDNRAIAVDQSGRIFSADYTGGRIQIFDKNGAFQMQIAVDQMPLNELAVDRKGNLYALQGSDLSRFSVESGEILGKTKIEYPTDLAVGLDGKLYLPTRKGEIQVLNSEGVKVKTILPAKDSTVTEIEQLAIDSTGNFYALERKTGAVFKLSPNGDLITRFGGRSSEADGKQKSFFQGMPQDIAIDSQNRVYVTQISRVSIFDQNGNFLNDFDIKQAFGVTLNDADELFVATRPFVTKYKLNF